LQRYLKKLWEGLTVKSIDNTYHRPVLLNESVEHLITDPNGTYVDVTFGGGGHSKRILKQLGDEGKLFSFDQDSDAALNQIHDERFCFIPQNFSALKASLFLNGVTKVDGILADLGVSSHQFDIPERGFSIRFNEAKLDMRMDLGSPLTAKEILNKYKPEQLADIFYWYGELHESRKIARLIENYRLNQSIETVGQLKEIIKPLTPSKKETQFFAKVFQALRIEVNREMEVLKQMLKQAEEVLKPGGKLVIISYHSLEDRLVKNYLKTGNFEGEAQKDFFGNLIRNFKPETSKPIIPSPTEIEENPRARSAKMRIGIRL
jgi:16S rRNA (cytosine1402-N4)-methyltransferase